MTAGWPELRRALDETGARLWWRDDDAMADTPELRRLLDLSRRQDIPLALAVVPGRLEASLPPLLQSCDGVTVLQHGWRHHNHAAEGKKSEYPATRPSDIVGQELRQGREILQAAFGQRFLPVFVPPWNRIANDHLYWVEKHFFGLSSFAAPVSARDIPCRIDILRWKPPPVVFAGAETCLEGLLRHARASLHIGVLTHHLAHDTVAWYFLETLFAELPWRYWASLPAILENSASSPSR